MKAGDCVATLMNTCFMNISSPGSQNNIGREFISYGKNIETTTSLTI